MCYELAAGTNLSHLGRPRFDDYPLASEWALGMIPSMAAETKNQLWETPDKAPN